MSTDQSARGTATRRLQADHTRARMLEAAWDMVRTHGPAAFTVRRLASRVVVATGLPSVHFGSREGLLDELRVRVWDQIDAVIATAQRDPALATVEARVRAGIRAVAQFALDEPHLYALLALVPGAVLSDAVLAREVRTAQPFVQRLIEGAAAGELRFSGDPVVFALALWTSVQGYVLRMSATLPAPFRAYQARVLDEILDAFFARVRAPELP